MENIAFGHGLEGNIALSFASCYINLLTAPLRYISYVALTILLKPIHVSCVWKIEGFLI